MTTTTPAAKRVNRINTVLALIGTTYHPTVPLADIFREIRDAGFEPVQEDGTSWSGFLCGRSGRATIGLRDLGTQKVSKWLCLSWYRMEMSGKYEVVSYVS